jgi:hypothetical protein
MLRLHDAVDACDTHPRLNQEKSWESKSIGYVMCLHEEPFHLSVLAGCSMSNGKAIAGYPGIEADVIHPAFAAISCEGDSNVLLRFTV